MENIDKIPTVGGRIKYIRESKGYMQIGVAMGAGISQKGLSKIELDQTNPSIYRLYRIAESLDVDVYMLIPRERWNTAYSTYGVFGHMLIRILKWTQKGKPTPCRSRCYLPHGKRRAGVTNQTLT